MLPSESRFPAVAECRFEPVDSDLESFAIPQDELVLIMNPDPLAKRERSDGKEGRRRKQRRVDAAMHPRRQLLAVILGGGAGTRLFPLTQPRSKPAVPLGGKYRLVDVAISNCINSD